MANVEFKRGLEPNLPDSGTSGAYYQTLDSNQLWLNNQNEALTQIGSNIGKNNKNDYSMVVFGGCDYYSSSNTVTLYFTLGYNYTGDGNVAGRRVAITWIEDTTLGTITTAGSPCTIQLDRAPKELPNRQYFERAHFAPGGRDASGDYNDAYSFSVIFIDDTSVRRSGNTSASTGSITSGTNNKSINKYTVTAGRNNTAVGVGSTALGAGNIVSGENSIVAGNDSYNHGANSYTFGNDNFTNSNMSFTSGYNNLNKGDNATIFGSHNIIGSGSFNTGTDYLVNSDTGVTITTPNSYEGNVGNGGSNVFIAGKRNIVTNWNSAALNEGNIVNGGDAFAAGKENTVNANYAASFGQSNIINSERGFATGIYNNVNAKNSTVFGRNNNVSDSGGTGIDTGSNLIAGYGNNINAGDKSIALGYENKIHGSNSVALGNKCGIGYSKSTNVMTASANNSIAMGNQSYCHVTGSVAIGCHVTADSTNQVVIGKHNAPLKATNSDGEVTDGAIFVVGNGSSSAAHNAIEVYKNGGRVNINSSADNAAISISAAGDKNGDIDIIASGANDSATLTLAAEASGTGLMRFSTDHLQYKSSYDDEYESAIQNHNATLVYGSTATIARIFGRDIKVTMPSSSGTSTSSTGSTVYSYSGTSSGTTALSSVNLGYTAFGASVTDRYYSSGAKTKQTYCYPVRVNSTNHLNARISAATTSDYGVVKIGSGLSVSNGVISAAPSGSCINEGIVNGGLIEYDFTQGTSSGGIIGYLYNLGSTVVDSNNLPIDNYVISFYRNTTLIHREILWLCSPSNTVLDKTISLNNASIRISFQMWNFSDFDIVSGSDSDDHGIMVVLDPTSSIEINRITLSKFGGGSL